MYIEKPELNNNEIYNKIWKKITFLGPWLEGRFMAEKSPIITREIANQFLNKHKEIH